MRPEPNERIDRFRRAHPTLGDSPAGANWGFFLVGPLRVMACDAGGWEHVSVSTEKRCPTWDEMCQVKNMFWSDDELVIQLHPPKSSYINKHPFCLHLWKPIGVQLPTPPTWMV